MRDLPGSRSGRLAARGELPPREDHGGAMRGSIGFRHERARLFATLVMTLAGASSCSPQWRASVCTGNVLGNCGQWQQRAEHRRLQRGVLPSDAIWAYDGCPNGIARVDVDVVDRSTLDVNVHCRTDGPRGTMVLGGTPAPAPVADAGGGR